MTSRELQQTLSEDNQFRSADMYGIMFWHGNPEVRPHPICNVIRREFVSYNNALDRNGFRALPAG